VEASLGKYCIVKKYGLGTMIAARHSQLFRSRRFVERGKRITLVEIPAAGSGRFQLQSRLPEFFGNEVDNIIFNLELTRDA
jgi:hypothetical protein